MSITQIVLPWPKPPLTLNQRGQTPGARAAHSAKVQMIRRTVALLARGIGSHDRIHVRLHYRQPDRRRRDADNLIPTQKACVDGLVDAGVIPDDCDPFLDWSRPQLHPPVKGEPGQLWLVITTEEKD